MTASASHKIDSPQENFFQYGFLISHHFIISPWIHSFPRGFTPFPVDSLRPRGFTPMRKELPMSQGVAEANCLASAEGGDLSVAGTVDVAGH